MKAAGLQYRALPKQCLDYSLKIPLKSITSNNVSYKFVGVLGCRIFMAEILCHVKIPIIIFFFTYIRISTIRLILLTGSHVK